MRVANFTDTYLPRRDGVITSIRTLAGALAADGHTTLTVVPEYPDQPRDDGHLRLRSVPCGIAGLRLSPWLVRQAAARSTLAAVASYRPDVVHVHTPGPLGLLGVLAARELGLPLVQSYHTDLHAYAEAYRVPALPFRASVRLYARRLGIPRPAMGAGRAAAVDGFNALLLGDADAIVVPTRAILGRVRLPVPAEQVHLVPTGVAARPSTAGAVATFRRTYGISPDDQVVLFVGRVNREKGIDLLLEAFVRVLAQCPRARLVLVGAMYEPRWFGELSRRIGAAARIADRIVVTGEQPPEVVAAAYAVATVFAFASRTDTQALVLQEAALAGLPAVLVDPVLHHCGPLAGFGVLADDNPVALGEALTRLLRDPAGTRELGAAAARGACGYTPSRYAAAMLDVYARAIAHHAAHSALPRGLAAPDAPTGLVPVV